MKTHDEVLQVLGDLSPADRLWIIDRLSPSARGALLNGVAGQSNSNPNSKVQPPVAAVQPVAQIRKADPVNDLLDSADPRQIAAALAREPAWVVHAALSRSRPWQAGMLELLSSSLRNDVEELERNNVRYADKLVASVESGLASVLDSTPAVQPDSWFDNFVSGLRTRMANRRMRFSA